MSVSKDERTVMSDRFANALLLVAVTSVVALPVLSGRVLGGQDIVNYLIHAQQTAANLREGLWFPSWAGGYNSGYGSPVLLFFPPLTSYAGALTVLAGLPVALGVTWLAVLAHLCSGLIVVGWLRSEGYIHAAVPAAIVYMIAPYRWIDLYLRSALGEHWAFVWPPLIMWIAGTQKLRPVARITAIGLAVAGLLLANIPLAVLFGFGLAAWFITSDRIRGFRAQVAAGSCLGFGVAAFFLVPLALASSLLDLETCFGPSVAAFRPSSNTLFADGLAADSLNSVFSWSVVATFGLLVIAWLLVTVDQRTSTNTVLIVSGALVVLVATTGPAGRLWDAVPVLRNLQFPWRLAALLTLLATALVARLPRRRAWFAVAVSAIAAAPFTSWNRTLPREAFSSPKPPAPPASGIAFPDPHVAWEAGSGGWYWRHDHLAELCLLPKTMPRAMLQEFGGVRSPSFDGIRNRPAIVVGDPAATVRVVEWGQVHREIMVDAVRGGTLLWHNLWFPEMHVTVDGEPVPVFVDTDTGLTTHAIGRGSHDVALTWHPFAALGMARTVSIASIASIAMLVGVEVLRRRSKPE